MISYVTFAPPANAKSSIIIPTWNNLPYLKNCIDSIRKNSTFTHEIVVHVNEGNDGTLEWLKQEKISFSHSPRNIGVCIAMNAAYTLAHADYIVFMNDDMYVCPQWDHYLWLDINTIGHHLFYISSTLIEHTETGNACVAAPFNFGKDVESFQEEKLLAQVDAIDVEDWVGTTWPPSVMHRRLWDIVGGFSIEFSPGMYSDPDFAMKAWQAGVRYFKGIGKSKIYHFQSKSTGKVKRNNGRRQFLRKWGISSSTFTKYYLHRGEKFRILEEPDPRKFTLILIKDFCKRLFVNYSYKLKG